jgi:hypothetical protein
MPKQTPERSTGNKVAIAVAVIGLLGVLGAALIEKVDFGGSSGGSEVVNMGPLELGTNRNGSDFSPNPERVESAEACRRLCGVTVSCRAMTFVSSPNNLPGGSCWLKTAIPSASPRSDMTSAVKVQ